MPYIKIDDYALAIDAGTAIPRTSGELNYILTSVITEYLKSKGLCYQTCNDIVGALDCCKEEFRRRIVNPYEDIKIKDNGDVYNDLNFYKK